MSHIVIDAREYSTSTGRYISRLLQYLQQLEKDDHYYSVLLKTADMPNAAITNPRFTKVICPHQEFSFDEQLGLLSQIKDLHPDLVHFGMVQQPVGYRGLSVTTMHDLTTVRFKNPAKNRLVFGVKQQVYKGVNKYVARKSAAIITPTEFVRQDVANYTQVDPAKIQVTYEAADPISDPVEPLPALAGQRFVMYVGRPLPHKNLGRLIDAFELLQKSQPDLRLVLAGKTDSLYEQCYDDVNARAIQNVVFTGYVSEGQLRWLYENCQAYVFPSLSEGFGLPGLEAMVHGAAVVASNATCLPEVYGQAAHYFDPLDTQAMAAAVDEVVNDIVLRTALIQKGRAQAATYSWQRMADQTLAIYNKALYDARAS